MRPLTKTHKTAPKIPEESLIGGNNCHGLCVYTEREMKRFRLFLLIPLLSILASCASHDSRLARTEYLGAPAVTQAPARGGYDDLSYWDGASASGSPRIKIDLNQQRAYFYKGATLAGVAVVSSGREGYGTPPGKFKVVQKSADHDDVVNAFTFFHRHMLRSLRRECGRLFRCERIDKRCRFFVRT